MSGTESGTTSVWQGGSTRRRSPLEEDVSADVCVIGAGMAGLSCAYWLAREGRNVVVLEGREIGAGETGRTTAHLSNAIDDRYFVMEDSRGEHASHVCAQSHTAAIHSIASTAGDEGIDCDLERVDGYLFLPPGESEEVLERELGAAHRAGLTGVERLESGPSLGVGACLRFPGQAQFHPLKYLAGLAAAIEARGGRIFTGSRVMAVKSEGPPRVVTLEGREVAAEAVIVATNSPINDVFAIHTKQRPFRTYAIAARVEPGAVAHALFWDTSETAGRLEAPYHYVRVAPGQGEGEGELLIVGGEDHLTGDASASPQRWDRLEAWARERVPAMGGVVSRWSGQVLEPMDRGAFIGRNPGGPDGVFVVTGDSGMGMTHGAIAGLMLRDLVAGREHPWSAFYDPSRKVTREVGQYLRHSARVAAMYTDWLKPGELAREIRPGEARLVREGMRLLAVHRDAGGAVHTRSAVCPHLGCIVHWNPVEGSWDCPCHGSRFSAKGDVLNGPSVTGLSAESGEASAKAG